jgi:hypothetical protein
MKKLLIPNQFQGIGDVIFSMTLVKNLAKDKYDILWPVQDYFVDGLQYAYPDVKFVSKDSMNINYDSFDDFENEEFRQIPLRFIGDITATPWYECMYQKYIYYNMDYNNWMELATYKRNMDKELQLFNLLGLEENEKYNLVSSFFGSQFQNKLNIKPENDFKIVEMKNINGFSLFDWSYVIENATNLYVAHSSPFFILELLTLRANEIHLYSRYPSEDHFLSTEKMHTKNYIYHTHP